MVRSNAMDSVTGDAQWRAEQLKFFWASFVGFQKIGDVSALITQAGLVSSLLTGLPPFYTSVHPQATARSFWTMTQSVKAGRA